MIYAIALILLQTSDSGLRTLTALFTPPQPIVGRYEVQVSPEAIEKVISDRPDTRFGAIDETDWLGAFGLAGTYDRSRVARLYGGQGVRVARGWNRAGDRFESLTLISPYPDASLSHLNPGTLVIRFVVTGR